MSEIKYMRLCGRCLNGSQRDAGALFHAVPTAENRALCGAKPSRHSAGWSDSLGAMITCQKCIRKLAKQSFHSTPTTSTNFLKGNQ